MSEPSPTGEGIHILAPISAGELVDKITILQIKTERMTDPAKLVNVAHELAALVALRDSHGLEGIETLSEDLKVVNETLWQVEDEIRELEAEGRFDARFIELARAVYATNDRRAAIKKEINLMVGSAIVEEKSYAGS